MRVSSEADEADVSGGNATLSNENRGLSFLLQNTPKVGRQQTDKSQEQRLLCPDAFQGLKALWTPPSVT